jgi:hypothetical protein
VSKNEVFWPFFFAESTVTGIVYMDMLEQNLMPILQEEGLNDILFQQMACLHFYYKLARSPFPVLVT